jgi:threonine/homoserine/homoserine lactone efflux protein
MTSCRLALRPLCFRCASLPDLPTYAGFVAAVLLMQAVPGPDTVLVAARGMGQGLRIALATVFGMTVLAGLIQLPLLAFGLGEIAGSHPAIFDAIRIAGAAYLVWLGLRYMFMSGTASREALPRDARSPWRAAIQGMIINLMNPNPLIFMLAFLPQFVDPARGPVALQLLVLGATQKVTGFGVLGAVALAAGRVGDRMAAKPGMARWQARIAGAILVALGIWLLASR